ncbi:MAG: IS4 family transposase [Planctomycetota bacterium]
MTPRVFLGQVLSADHSCRAAVARLLADRVSRGLGPCSRETGAYCQARKRLPEEFFATTTRETAAALDRSARPEWLWKRRRVFAYDGSTVSMPDTVENQQAYPQAPQQRPGVGFPLARIAAFFSLASGAVIDLAICPYFGKGNSEMGMLHQLWSVLRRDDVMLADRYMCAWHEIYLLKQRGVDAVIRINHHRKVDFRRGKRLGEGDHLVEWTKPQLIRTLDREAFNTLPERFTVRETRVRVDQPGFRGHNIVVVTTLLNADEVTADDLAELYRARWNAELDLRSLKETLQMNTLRCKTPELVRKEVWTHLLAYNLIRTVMAQAATTHATQPRTISFKGAVQVLGAFGPMIAAKGWHAPELRLRFYRIILDAIASQRVADRPGGFEPRLIKRRNGKYDLLTKPRHETKQRMLKQLA